MLARSVPLVFFVQAQSDLFLPCSFCQRGTTWLRRSHVKLPIDTEIGPHSVQVITKLEQGFARRNEMVEEEWSE